MRGHKIARLNMERERPSEKEDGPGEAGNRALPIPEVFAGPTRRRVTRRVLTAISALALVFLAAYFVGGYLWISYHFRAARTALEHYHNTAALSHLRHCVAAWPNDPATLLLAARAERRGGNFDAAEELLERFEHVQGVDNDELTIERTALRAERGDLDAVRPFCQRLIDQEHPATALLWEALTHGYLRRFRLDAAGHCVQRWLQGEPDNPQAHLFLALLHDRKSRTYDAMVEFRHVLELDPERDDARLQLAQHQLDLGLGGEALPHLEYLRHRLPNNGLVPVLQARALDQVGRAGTARELLDDVLAAHPKFAPALIERSRLALRDGDAERAVNGLREAVALDPSNSQAQYQLFVALEGSGQKEEARRQQARLKQLEDDLNRLQEIATRLMPQRPHDPAVHYEAGQIALRVGAQAEGVDWLINALREDPHYLPAHRALADYYRRIGDLGRAAHHQRFLPPTPTEPGGGRKPGA
jgi:tetratricopeptide (TPR) repeat protein